MRLDKLLADAGEGTRSQVKAYIKKGLVSVNGRTASGPQQQVDTSQDEILLNGRQVHYEAYAYYMLHKPAGLITATKDASAGTVMDLLADAGARNLSPVGRLDKDTEGLLLVTNDGALAHKLLSPKNHVPKTYYARLDGAVDAQVAAQFASGVDIGEEKPAMPAELTIISGAEAPGCEVMLTIYEGRFHQVKRMFLSVGRQVLYLKRLSMGSLKLDETLKKGCYRPLHAQELAALSMCVEGKRKG